MRCLNMKYTFKIAIHILIKTSGLWDAFFQCNICICIYIFIAKRQKIPQISVNIVNICVYMYIYLFGVP